MSLDHGDSPAANEGALVLARIRAAGWADADLPAAVLASAAAAAARVDRRLIEVRDGANGRSVLVLGWADGAGPAPDLHPSAPVPLLSPVPNLVWATCLAAAWQHPGDEPYPGLPFHRMSIVDAVDKLGADRPSVVRAFDSTLQRAGLISVTGSVGRLGPWAAALPATVWSTLRRLHDRLPHALLDTLVVEPEQSVETVVARGLNQPPNGPAGYTETLVRAAVTALEAARGPVASRDLPALADPAVRRITEEVLGGCGRALVPTRAGDWTTGYTDVVENALAAERTGTLSREERAVLALVLLRTVAIPRAQGRHHHDEWMSTEHPVTFDDLKANRAINDKTIIAALRGLRAAGYVTRAASGGYVPGPALARVSRTRKTGLWEDLVLVTRPDGALAEGIRTKRLQPDSELIQEI